MTTDAILIDGANSTCGASRPEQTPAAVSWSAACAFGLAIVLLLQFRSWKKQWGRWEVAGLLAVAASAAAPGFWALAFKRADAPSRRVDTSRAIAAVLDPLNAFASTHHLCVRVLNECVACEPILRFAIPRRFACAHEEGSVSLRPNAISTGCRVHDDVLDCGKRE